MRNSKYNSIIIFAVSLTFYLLFAHLQAITDPVESNYALTAREMLLSGDWLSPQIYGQYWFDKPIFYYWVVAASFKIFGISELAARIGSAVFAALGVTLVYWFAAKVSTVKKGLIAAVILATSLQYIVFAKLIHTDTALFFFANAVLVCFYLGFIRYKNTRNWYFLIYPCAAMAVLTKGPVGVLLPAMIIFAFLLAQKNWREVKKMYLLRGFIIFAVVALPWYVLMYAKHGATFIETFFGIHNYLRATVSEHPRSNVFFYYPLLLMAATLPWTGLGLLSFYHGALAAWRNRCVLSRFCLIWIGVYILFYSAMATKYPTYIFPVLFPLAVLIAQHLSSFSLGKKATFAWIVFPFSLMFTVFIFLLWHFLPGYSMHFYALVIVLLGLTGWYQLKCGDIVKTLPAAAASIVTVFLFLAITAFPHAAESHSDKDWAAQIQPYDAENIGFYRQYSTSAVFYSGKTLIKVVGEQERKNYNPKAKDWSRKHTMPVQSLQEFAQIPGAKKNILFVEKSKWAQFMAESQTGYSAKVIREYPDFWVVEIYLPK